MVNIFQLGKKPEIGTLKVEQRKKDMPPPEYSIPPKELPKFPEHQKPEEPEGFEETILKLLGNIIHNQGVIYNKLVEKDIPVLSDDEIKYIPEEKKDAYFTLKQDNPEDAEIMLEGYKARGKKK